MENKIALNLKLIGFKEPDAKRFSAILDLAEYGLDAAWKIVDTDSADFYLLTETPNINDFKDLPHERCFFYGTDTSTHKDQTVILDTSRLPSIHSLIARLNRASSLGKVDEEAQPEPSKPIEPFSSTQVPFLKQLLNTNGPTIFSLNADIDCPPLYVYPKKQLFYCDIPLEKCIPHFLNQNLTVELISVSQLIQTTKQADLAEQPLHHLIWYTSFSASQGQLMQELSDKDVIHLTDWPYLGRDSRRYIKLATFLKNHSACLQEATQSIGLTTELANDFYNACQIAGLIEKNAIIAPPPKAPDPEKLSFLDKIKNRLKQ